MKATIESTSAVVEILDEQGRRTSVRVWEGVSEGGVPFTAYIATVQVHRAENHDEFQRDLQEHKQPAPETQAAIDMRFVI